MTLPVIATLKRQVAWFRPSVIACRLEAIPSRQKSAAFASRVCMLEIMCFHEYVVVAQPRTCWPTVNLTKNSSCLTKQTALLLSSVMVGGMYNRYFWWTTFFSPSEHDGVGLRLKRVLESNNAAHRNPVASSLHTIISRAVDAHWIASVTSGLRAGSPTSNMAARLSSSPHHRSSPSWRAAREAVAAGGRGGVGGGGGSADGSSTADTQHARRPAHNFRHCFNLYEQARSTA